MYQLYKVFKTIQLEWWIVKENAIWWSYYLKLNGYPVSVSERFWERLNDESIALNDPDYEEL